MQPQTAEGGWVEGIHYCKQLGAETRGVLVLSGAFSMRSIETASADFKTALQTGNLPCSSFCTNNVLQLLTLSQKT